MFLALYANVFYIMFRLKVYKKNLNKNRRSKMCVTQIKN